MVRIAAIGDLHLRGIVPSQLVRDIQTIHHHADVLVIAGDITNNGRIVQVELAAELFRRAQLPMIAVLGNHDRRSMRMGAFKETLALAGVTVLDGSAIVLDGGVQIGFAGVGGSGGGFWPVEGPDTLSRRACQALAVRARREAARLDQALAELESDLTVVVTHFAPTLTTLGTEPRVKYPLLGNCALAEVIDRYDVDLVLHGHAHHGNPYGRTPGGTPVYNVASDIIRRIVVHEITPRGPKAARLAPPAVEAIA